MEKSSSLTIELKQVRFFAYHGVYANEAVTGNEFEVDMVVSINAPASPITQLNQTISYVSLFELVKERMQQREDLLETIAMDIVNRVHDQFNHVNEVSICITKCTPPFENFSGRVAVTYLKQF